MDKFSIAITMDILKYMNYNRSFIMPDQESRKAVCNHKFKIDTDTYGSIEDKVIILIDDSIVRGHTSKKIVQMVKKCGAKKVFFASASPPIRYQNIYGIDMPSTSELIAHNKSIADIKKYIKADELIYQDLEDLKRSATIGNPKITEFEDSVFTGKYRVGNITVDYLNNLEQSRSGLSK